MDIFVGPHYDRQRVGTWSDGILSIAGSQYETTFQGILDKANEITGKTVGSIRQNRRCSASNRWGCGPFFCPFIGEL